jgi:acetyl-CoA carboxylase alpha subunit
LFHLDNVDSSRATRRKLRKELPLMKRLEKVNLPIPRFITTSGASNFMNGREHIKRDGRRS